MAEATIAAPEKVAQHLVTSENRAEFMDKRMDIAKPLAAPTAAIAVTVEPAKVEPAKVAAAEAPKGDAAALEEVVAEEKKATPDPEKKQKFSLRLSELTQKRKEAEEKAAASEAARVKAEQEAADLRAKAATIIPAAELGAEPQRAMFTSEDDYLRARVDYAVDKKVAERTKAAQDAQAKLEGERVIQTYAQRLAATKKEITDYDARIEAQKELPIAPHIRDAIYESEQGPRIALHFADYPEEADRINRLGVNAGLREFGKIEAMIESKAAPKADLKVVPKLEVSAAPAPINPLRASGVGEPEAKIDSAGNFKGTYAEWKALRRAGKIK